MSRPLRIEFADATYHITVRGDRREVIYRDDQDRGAHLDVISQAMDRFDARVWAYCLMGNHFHLVLQTAQPNLSRLMRHVNGVYTQAFNRRHGLVGHLFQGRFKAILVDCEAYLLALCRYVERNPVAAGFAGAVRDWPWSSYRAHAALTDAPPWLDVDGLQGLLLGRSVASDADRRLAARRYAALVEDTSEADAAIWQSGLRQQVFLGDEAFVLRMQAMAAPEQRTATEVPRLQRRQPCTLQECLNGAVSPAHALREAYREGGMTMTAIAEEMGLSISRVSRMIAAAERADAKGKT